jgi:DUF2075 family protein
MHLYSGSSVDFVADATQNRIATKLEKSFFDAYRYKPGQSEVRSWQNSLRAMSQAITLGGFEDHGVVLEWRLPLSSRRLDCMLTGHDVEERPNAVIVELKQWETAAPSNIDDCVNTFIGGGVREVLHPSRQVGNYQRYMLDTHTTFSTGNVALQACSYAHNVTVAEEAALFDAKFETLLQQYPLFAGDQVDELVDFLNASLAAGNGGPVLQEVLGGRYHMHKRLLEHTAGVIRREPTYILLDEQQVAFNGILTHVRARNLSMTKTAVIVRGGPGTGKSVVALNLVAELAGEGIAVHHATGSKAFTENVRKVVGTRGSEMFKYFNSYMNDPGFELDVVICDEAHRIRESSVNRFTPKAARTEKPQIQELIEVAKVSVFFIDDDQVVRPGEVGSAALIKGAAAELGAHVVEYELESQFRCNGSDSYIQWVENTLDIRKTPHVLFDPADEFDFDVVDSPQELEALIRLKAAEGHTARLSAGFCWPWSEPNVDGSLVHDVQLGDWSMPWNAKDVKRKLASDIPKSNFWASDPNGVNQVGCVYTAQGFEYDYAGVIFGKDLVYRPREGWVGQREFSQDRTVKRAKSSADFLSLVKNTYRVLLTRGLKGCYVYFEDDQTRDFVLSRLAGPGQ